jgi:uncharacterized protein (DUF305 family)
MKRALTLSSVAAVSILVLTACGETARPGGGDPTTATDVVTSVPAPARSTETTTAEKDGEIAREHNNADVMFARMMIPHHQQAVDTSEILLTKEDVPAKVGDFAQRVIDTQTSEIEQMDTMLDVWGQQAGSGHRGGMGPSEMGSGGMGGMLHREGVAALESAQGAEAVRLYLEHMIPHHEGAIDMARNEVNSGRNPQIIALAERMIEVQAAEVGEMEQMLQDL